MPSLIADLIFDIRVGVRAQNLLVAFVVYLVVADFVHPFVHLALSPGIGHCFLLGIDVMGYLKPTLFKGLSPPADIDFRYHGS